MPENQCADNCEILQNLGKYLEKFDLDLLKTKIKEVIINSRDSDTKSFITYRKENIDILVKDILDEFLQSI